MICVLREGAVYFALHGTHRLAVAHRSNVQPRLVVVADENTDPGHVVPNGYVGRRDATVAELRMTFIVSRNDPAVTLTFGVAILCEGIGCPIEEVERAAAPVA